MPGVGSSRQATGVSRRGPQGTRAPLLRVDLRLRGWLRGALPGGRTILRVPVGTTVSGVLDVLGIPVGPCLWIVNGEVVGYDTPVRDGDVLEVAMMASGG